VRAGCYKKKSVRSEQGYKNPLIAYDPLKEFLDFGMDKNMGRRRLARLGRVGLNGHDYGDCVWESFTEPFSLLFDVGTLPGNPSFIFLSTSESNDHCSFTFALYANVSYVASSHTPPHSLSSFKIGP